MRLISPAADNGYVQFASLTGFANDSLIRLASGNEIRTMGHRFGKEGIANIRYYTYVSASKRGENKDTAH